MKIKYFATTWGLEDLDYEAQFSKIKNGGYDGVETGRIKPDEINQVLELLEKYQLLLICQQWTEGKTAGEHAESFLRQADINSRLNPVYINSHTGKDHFSFSDNLDILTTALEFERIEKIPVTHETHRGRFAFAAHITAEFLEELPELKLTADFSHWCCVAESYLEDQEENLNKAINKAYHIHARIGSTQSSQVNDPRSEEWKNEKKLFLKWWKEITLNANSLKGILPVTCEFGPHPYMPTAPFTAAPLASQWEINLYIKELLKRQLG